VWFHILLNRAYVGFGVDKSGAGCYVNTPKRRLEVTDTKKITGFIVFIAITMSGVSFADTYHWRLSAGRSALEGRFDVTREIDQGLLTAGVGAVYSNNSDDYKIADVKFSLGNEIFVPGLRCDLGFKGLFGDVEKDHRDGDLMAMGFLLSAAYETPRTISPIPVVVSVAVCASPEPLCFLDSERYLEIETNLSVHIIENGAIVLGYKYIKVRIDDDPGHWNMSDDFVFIGFQLKL